MSTEHLAQIREREIADSARSFLYFSLLVLAVAVIIGSLILVL